MTHTVTFSYELDPLGVTFEVEAFIEDGLRGGPGVPDDGPRVDRMSVLCNGYDLRPTDVAHIKVDNRPLWDVLEREALEKSRS